VASYDDLRAALENYKPGEDVTVRFIRDNKEQTAKVKLQASN
jgi:S1-C subfamily serine protease